MSLNQGIYHDVSDADLVKLISEGNRMAFAEIYNRYHAKLYIHVFNKLRLREESRDIVQELFTSLWNKHAEIQITSSISTYLFVSARYKIFNFISHRETESKYINQIKEFVDKDNFITDHLIRERELQLLIDREIAALPDKMRRIFELSRKQYLSHKQIAAELGISEQTVKTQVNNALKILRTKLGTALFTAFIL